MNTLIFAKILLSFLHLSFASYQDLKRREVDDRVWLSMILFGVLFALFESFSIGNFSPLERSFLAIGACFFIALIITSFNLFGGADGMALIGIGAMIPKFERDFIFFLFPLSVFNNALLCVLVLPLILLSYNLMRKSKISNVKASTLKRGIAYFLGYPI
ncbi:MAG: prepilin peptidase, partial [Candidatus Methanofastidiosia archaeon]